MIEIYQRHSMSTLVPARDDSELVERVHDSARSTFDDSAGVRPIIHVYIYPRTSTADDVRMPGYWTMFELEERLEPTAAQNGD